MWIALAAAIGMGQSSAGPVQVQGAQKLFENLKIEVSKPAKPRPYEKFRIEIAAFNANSNAMSVPDAANGWLKLLSAWEALRGDPEAAAESGGYSTFGLEMLVTALPMPEAWTIIRRDLIKRPSEDKNKVLVMLFDMLLGDSREVIRKCESLKKPVTPGLPEDVDMEGGEILKVELPLTFRLHDTELAGNMLEKGSKMFSFFFFDGVPDLVRIFGREKAAPILLRMFRSARSTFDKFNGAETIRLGKGVMLANLEKIKIPQWTLAEGPDDIDFILKLTDKYGPPAFSNESRPGWASSYYIGYLLEMGKIDEAKRLVSVKNNRYDLDQKTLSFGPERLVKLFDGLSKVLDADPNADVWTSLWELAKRAGKLELARKRMEEALAGSMINNAQRRSLLTLKALVQAEEGTESLAIATLIQALKIPLDESRYDAGSRKLLDLALATGSREAADAAFEFYAKEKFESYSANDLFGVLVSQGRLAEAQQNEIRKAATVGRFEAGGPKPETPVLLAELYYLANRPEEIVELLKSYPSWPANDLFKVLTLRQNANYREEFWRKPMGFYAAWALARTDQKKLAVQTMHAMLAFDLGQDESYELMNEIEGEPALAYYDQLIKTDPFEPRPLFWKADLLLRLGRLDEAEAHARKALSVDPSDGQARPGQRLNAYGILGRILRARGKPDEAATCEHIVQAIRLAEKGDRYKDADLLPQAMSLYKEADKVFADAYCVHARMAATLSRQGKTQEAYEHYRRAYELMPDSFGEVEVLCMECESGFRPDIARSVFEKLAEQMPNKPQVHYLLGKLELQAKEFDKALASFENAVRLDPRYLNAWKQIVALEGSGAATPEQIEEAALQVARLDPMSLHGGYLARGHVRDYAKLWKVYEEVYRSLPSPPSGPLYPLKELKEGNNPFSGRMWLNFNRGAAGADIRSGPGGPLTQDPIIQTICGLYTRTN